MKHLFSLCLMILLVFVSTTQSLAFEQDFDPVEVESVIYCDCDFYVEVAPQFENSKTKEFATPKALPFRQTEIFGIFFEAGNYRSRDNIEGDTSKMTHTKIIFSAVTSPFIWYRK